MASVRGAAFAVAFYVTTALFLVFGSPLLFAPRRWAIVGLKAHGRTCLFLMKWIGGCSYEVRGRENLPERPFLVVAKHQSAWETMALTFELDDPAIVLKAELTSIPLYGTFCCKFEHIIVRRDRFAVALRQMVTDARARADQDREIVIFPEGTRREPGSPPAYKPGYLALYSALDLPVVPIALNSGVFWPPRSAFCQPGHIVLEFGPAIAPGLDRDAAASRIVAAVETRTAALIREAAEAFPDNPNARPALARLEASEAAIEALTLTKTK